jgi:hypothetical protein
MTDYHQLIARAVEGLDSSTGEVRRALYERARNALVAQLRSSQISEADINKQRLALEKAIRKVEAEAARKSRSEPRSDPRATAPPANPPPTDVPQTAVLPSARDLLLSARSSLENKERRRKPRATHAKHTRQRHRNTPQRKSPRHPRKGSNRISTQKMSILSTTIRGRNATSVPTTRRRTSTPSSHKRYATRRAARRRKRNMNGTGRRSRDFPWC